MMKKCERRFNARRKRCRLEQLESRQMLTALTFEESSPLEVGQFVQLLTETEAPLAVTHGGELVRISSPATPGEVTDILGLASPIREASFSKNHQQLTVMTDDSVVDFKLDDDRVVSSQVVVENTPNLVASRHAGYWEPSVVNADGVLTVDDLFAVTNGTLVVGDANFDGRFNSEDMVSVFALGFYDDDDLNNASWTSGDWNCDGEFDSSDLVAAFQAGAYVP